MELKKALRAAEQDRSDVAQKRVAWSEWQRLLDAQHLVFIDETWVKTNMARTRGWAPRGERLVSAVPHGHWKTSTFVGALRLSGLTAPMVLDGALNGEYFLAYVEQQLVPTLQPKDLVILDNLSSHKVAGVREAIARAGAEVWYLPPYSPDFNPIENLFSKLKALLRKAAERTVEGLWRKIGELVENFTPDECQNYFRHCGYNAN
jgi:transposase